MDTARPSQMLKLKYVGPIHGEYTHMSIAYELDTALQM